MFTKNILFWQPRIDFLKKLVSFRFGRILLIFLNYLIWIFFIYISYLLLRYDFKIFWQLFFATLLAESIERLVKKKVFWRRPMFIRHDQTPSGLVDKWYQSGAFPSGHTIKTLFFLLFIIQYPVFSVPLFLGIVTPLLSFRVLVGFHYPADILGGALIGIIIWFFCHSIYLNTFLTPYLQSIFNTIFLINY